MEAGEWRSDDLSLLASFIEEQQKWLDSVLVAVGWTEERVKQGLPLLMQCPFNQNHFIDKNSVEKHKLKCRYGVVGVVSDNEEPEPKNTFVRISPSIAQAVKKYAQNERLATDIAPLQQQSREFINQSDVVVESHDHFSSLESRATTPNIILTQGPLHIIRYIKSWSTVPADFHQVASNALNPVEIKAWLFTNLTPNHSYSSQIGGEMQAVDVILQALTGRPSVTPNSTISELTPLLNLECRLFVLRLWKFLHIASLQKQFTILDSVVQELTPLPPSEVSFLTKGQGILGDGTTEVDSFADKIQAIAAEEVCPRSPLPSLPMNQVPYIFNTEERRLLYDYVVEVGGSVAGSQSKDPSLFRDDAAAIRAKLKQQAREESERMIKEERGGGGGKESILHQMKRERDYRRRRQKYRARNVHITRRTPAQVMHDIINARMLEISGGSSLLDLSVKDEKKDSEVACGSPTSSSRLGEQEGPTTAQSQERERRVERDSRHGHSRREESRSRETLQWSRGTERSRRSRSRGRSRSRDRESRRKRSRSKSRERYRRNSHSDQRDRDGHRKRSRDKESHSSKSSKHHISRSNKHKERSERDRE